MENGLRVRSRRPSVRRHATSILAINAEGLVTKANAPARKALAPVGAKPEGTELGVLLASVLAGRNRGSGGTRLSFDTDDEREDVLLVLSAGEDRPPIIEEIGRPGDEGRTPRERAISALADFIAHELRNPLGAILGFSQVLENRFSSMSDQDRREALETIHSEAERSLMILEGLLRLAQARARPRMDLANVPLHAVLGKVVSAHRQRNPHRAVAFSGDVPLFARANSLWVELAVANLFSNAEKYTPKDRPIEVAFHQTGNEASIMILDSGSGLRPELYPSLWNVYAKGPDREVTVSGSGIGLALCKELVEGMGGHVWAGPRTGGGSAFALSLPAPWDMAVPPPLATPLSQAESAAVGSATATIWS